MGRAPAGERGWRDRAAEGLVGLAAIGLVLVAARFGALEGAELAVSDRFLRALAAEPERDATGRPLDEAVGRSAGAPVVLLSLSEADFARHGYPLPDALLATALERLAALGATGIGVDLYRVAPADGASTSLEGWNELARIVAAEPRIVMTELLSADDGAGMRAPPFVSNDRVGFNNMLVDPGRSVRRGYLYAWEPDGTAHVSLALRLASLHLAREGIRIGPDAASPDVIRIGATALPPLDEDDGPYVGLDAGGYQIPLDFRRDARDFTSLALDDLLGGRIDAQAVAGRVVVVGTDAPSVKDDFTTPLSPHATVKGHRLHAQLVDQLIRAGRQGDAPRRSLADPAEAALVAGFGLAATAVALEVGLLAVVVPLLMIGLALPVALAYSLFVNGLVVPSVAPALAWGLAGGASFGVRARREAKAQRQLVALFRRFSSAKVADHLWRERAAFMAGGRPRPQRVVLTALMSDLEGYTSAAEKLEPEALLAWIDGYMDAMTRVIEAHGGHVDDYVGDGIKANFGVPIPSTTRDEIDRDATQAVACALAMGRALEACNRDWAARGLPEVRQRIGIATGPAVVGAIGSRERMKYTSIGDVVNTAARLESFVEPAAVADARPAAARADSRPDSRPETGRILIGEETRRRIGERFAVRDLGTHRLKGKDDPVRVFHVLGEREPRSDGHGRNDGKDGSGGNDRTAAERQEDRA